MGAPKTIKIPKKDKYLAEFLGILFGDGNSYQLIKGTKIRVYSITITGDIRKDLGYFKNFIRPLIKKLFGLDTRFKKLKSNGVQIIADGVNLIKFLEIEGFPPGDKIKNRLKVPKWIRKNKVLTIAFIRGLIDTDGSIFRMSNKDPNLLRISLTNYIPNLLDDVRKDLIKLGFHPSKIISNKHFFLSRKKDIKRYTQMIGFSNPKHIKRLKKLSKVIS